MKIIFPHIRGAMGNQVQPFSLLKSGNYSIYGLQRLHYIPNSTRNGHTYEYVHQEYYMANWKDPSIDMCWL